MKNTIHRRPDDWEQFQFARQKWGNENRSVFSTLWLGCLIATLALLLWAVTAPAAIPEDPRQFDPGNDTLSVYYPLDLNHVYLAAQIVTTPAERAAGLTRFSGLPDWAWKTSPGWEGDPVWQVFVAVEPGFAAVAKAMSAAVLTVADLGKLDHWNTARVLHGGIGMEAPGVLAWGGPAFINQLGYDLTAPVLFLELGRTGLNDLHAGYFLSPEGLAAPFRMGMLSIPIPETTVPEGGSGLAMLGLGLGAIWFSLLYGRRKPLNPEPLNPEPFDHLSETHGFNK